MIEEGLQKTNDSLSGTSTAAKGPLPKEPWGFNTNFFAEKTDILILWILDPIKQINDYLNQIKLLDLIT